MVAKGHFQNGVVVLEDPSQFREGQEVTVTVDERLPTDLHDEVPDDAVPTLEEVKAAFKEAAANMSDDLRRTLAEVDASSWDGLDDEEAARRRASADRYLKPDDRYLKPDDA